VRVNLSHLFTALFKPYDYGKIELFYKEDDQPLTLYVRSRRDMGVGEAIALLA
jgi:inorganic pyrophosphatase